MEKSKISINNVYRDTTENLTVLCVDLLPTDPLQVLVVRAYVKLDEQGKGKSIYPFKDAIPYMVDVSDLTADFINMLKYYQIEASKIEKVLQALTQRKESKKQYLNQQGE